MFDTVAEIMHDLVNRLHLLMKRPAQGGEGLRVMDGADTEATYRIGDARDHGRILSSCSLRLLVMLGLHNKILYEQLYRGIGAESLTKK